MNVNQVPAKMKAPVLMNEVDSDASVCQVRHIFDFLVGEKDRNVSIQPYNILQAAIFNKLSIKYFYQRRKFIINLTKIVQI